MIIACHNNLEEILLELKKNKDLKTKYLYLI